MKKFLFGLIIAFFGLCSFSNAGDYKLIIPTIPNTVNQTFTTSNWFDFPFYENYSGSHVINFCFNGFDDYNSFQVALKRWNGSSYSTWIDPENIASADYCSTWNLSTANTYGRIALSLRPRYQFSVTSSNKLFNYYSYVILSGDLFQSGGDCPTCEECEECQECQSCPTTGDVLSQYCDINYCVSNSLCPVSGSGFEWSALFINNIQFPGHDVINISIPDYIQWDYTSSTGLFDLSVGSGYDQDYIDSVLKINSYRPDSKDFTQIFVSGLTLIFPYIFVALLIMFIWKLLKRIFK